MKAVLAVLAFGIILWGLVLAMLHVGNQRMRVLIAQAHAEEHKRFYIEHTEKIGEHQNLFVLHDMQEQKCTLVLLQQDGDRTAMTSQPVACDR